MILPLILLATDEVIERVMQVEYLGMARLTSMVLPHMIAQKSGHIVGVSSILGKVATPLRSASCAAKQ